jgi:hypothetical protein
VATQCIVRLTSGQVVVGVNYRMAPYSVPAPAVPSSPAPFAGGFYHIQTARGWVDLQANAVQSISVVPGVST